MSDFATLVDIKASLIELRKDLAKAKGTKEFKNLSIAETSLEEQVAELLGIDINNASAAQKIMYQDAIGKNI